MMNVRTSDLVVANLKADVERSAKGAKRIKIRTLLSRFGYSKRSDANTAEITRLLSEAGLSLNPPLVRFGEQWELSTEDWILLSTGQTTTGTVPKSPVKPRSDWNADGWFDRLASLELRTEKEVEIKFIVPLLSRLGYSDDDRFDGMPVPAAHGSRKTTLVIDFALFNNAVESLRGQPLLTVEAKRENRLTRLKDLASAHNQAKSYCLWTQCDFFMVTDSRTVQVFEIARGRFGEPTPIVSCQRHELSERFPEIYGVLSKDGLTARYLAKFAAPEELR